MERIWKYDQTSPEQAIGFDDDDQSHISQSYRVYWQAGKNWDDMFSIKQDTIFFSFPPDQICVSFEICTYLCNNAHDW